MTQEEKNLETILNVEGQVLRAEVVALHKLAKRVPKDLVIIEIGSYRGRSTIALALGALSGNSNRIYSIDPHLEFTGIMGGTFNPQDQAELYKNLSAARVGSIVYVVSLPSVDVAKAWQEKNVGLIWIDGDHRYDSVKADFFSWKPFLIPGSIVAFHDCDTPDVSSLIQEIDGKEIELVEQVLSLGIYSFLGEKQHE